MIIPSNISKYLEQYFDKIVVVSIPRFTDRHERVKKNLEGLSFDFFWGADKLEPFVGAAKTNGTYDEQKAKNR